jgi:hypothetical protein
MYTKISYIFVEPAISVAKHDRLLTQSFGRSKIIYWPNVAKWRLNPRAIIFKSFSGFRWFFETDCFGRKNPKFVITVYIFLHWPHSWQKFEFWMFLVCGWGSGLDWTGLDSHLEKKILTVWSNFSRTKIKVKNQCLFYSFKFSFFLNLAEFSFL